MRLKASVFLLLIALYGTAHAQTEKLWESYYTPANDTLDIQGTKTDALGNLYTYGSEGRNLFLQKVNANGQIEWTITNNTLITPVPGDPYTENHLLQWAKITDLVPVYAQDTFIVVTGEAKFFNFMFNSSAHCFNIKFLLSGDTVWSRIYDNPSLSARGWIIQGTRPQANFSHNSIFLATLAFVYPADGGTGGEDILLSRLNTDNGNILSYKNFSSQPVLGEFLENFTFNEGFFYISGLYSIGRSFPVSHPVGGWESFLIKLDTSFNRIAEAYEGDPSSFNYAIQHEVDNEGNMHLLIQNQDSLKSYQKTILFIKYNHEGNELWRFKYNDSLNSNDSALLFNLDEQGNVRIVAQTTNHNRSLFLVLDSHGNLTSILKRDSTPLLMHSPPSPLSGLICTACPRIKTKGSVPVFTIENSTYYFNLKSQSTGISQAYSNTQHWWDVDTSLIPGYAPLSIVFTDTFDFVTIALTDTLTDKKIQYRKYRDTSWLKIPLNLSATAVSSNEIRLEWTALPDYKTGFVIEKSTDGILFNAIDTISQDSLTYTDSGLNKNTLYYYQVRSLNQYGASLPSLIASDTTFDNVGIKKEFLNSINIYPNPFNNTFYVELSEDATEHEFILSDIQGREILRQKTNTGINAIETTSLHNGLYMLKITNLDNSLSYTFKILKL